MVSSASERLVAWENGQALTYILTLSSILDRRHMRFTSDQDTRW
jgi:hypothetical protein